VSNPAASPRLSPMKATVPFTPVTRSTSEEGQSKVMELILFHITSLPHQKRVFPAFL